VRLASWRDRWSPVWFSVLLHGSIVLLFVGVYLFIRKPPPREVRLAIEATVVRAAPRQAPRPVPPAPAPAPEPEPVAPEPVVSPPPVPDPAEEKQREAEQRAAEKRDAQKREEEQRVAKERAADAKRLAEEKAAKLKAEKEAAAREKAAQQKAAQEKAAQEKLAREKTQAEQQRVQREADLNAQIAAEERLAAARASGVMANYVAQITAKIEKNWIRPASAQPGLNCEVRVTQLPGGTVVGAQVGRCNGDESVRQSIEAAVIRASPLPLPSDPALFERNLVVTFRPES
jgi:hypothetical protein